MSDDTVEAAGWHRGLVRILTSGLLRACMVGPGTALLADPQSGATGGTMVPGT